MADYPFECRNVGSNAVNGSRLVDLALPIDFRGPGKWDIELPRREATVTLSITTWSEDSGILRPETIVVGNGVVRIDIANKDMVSGSIASELRGQPLSGRFSAGSCTQ